MSDELTKGRLVAVHFKDDLFDLRTEEQSKRLTTECVASFIFKPNAERLAACWNACDGLSMDAFDGGWTAKGLSQYAKSLEVRLTEAAALLRDVVRPHDEQARQAEKAGEASNLNPLAGRIHEFLEAAGPLIAFARPLVHTPAPVTDALPDIEGGSCD